MAVDLDIPHPRQNPLLLGHGESEAAFLDAWNSGRLAHSWLICGPKGIGKSTFAYRIAAFVLSGGGVKDMFGDGPTSLEVDGSDPAARMVYNGAHPDLKVVERGFSDDAKSKRSKDIVIDDIRAAGEFLSLTPSLGGWRVVIVDAADEMNRNAANAILKILEEPPKNALMILLSHSPGRLLPTIKSRCRRLMMGPLSEEIMVDLLGRFSPGLSADETSGLVGLAEGSIGKAIGLIKEGGLDLYKDLSSVMAAFPKLDMVAVHAFADRAVARGKADGEGGWATLSELFLWWLAKVIRELGANSGSNRVQGLESWLGVWEKVQTLFAKVDAVNLDRKQALLTAMLMVDRAARH
jgi:DNA polymerase-3 subunit delta'